MNRNRCGIPLSLKLSCRSLVPCLNLLQQRTACCRFLARLCDRVLPAPAASVPPHPLPYPRGEAQGASPLPFRDGVALTVAGALHPPPSPLYPQGSAPTTPHQGWALALGQSPPRAPMRLSLSWWTLSFQPWAGRSDLQPGGQMAGAVRCLLGAQGPRANAVLTAAPLPDSGPSSCSVLGRLCLARFRTWTWARAVLVSGHIVVGQQEPRAREVSMAFGAYL